MDKDRPIDDPRVNQLDVAVKVAAILLALIVIGFSTYYYLDRYAFSSPSVAELAVSRDEAAAIDDPQSFDARMRLASAYIQRGMIGEAMDQYQAALKLRPGSTDAMLGLALMYAGMDNDKAQPLLEKVIEGRKAGEFASEDTKLATAYYTLATIQYQASQYELAAGNALEASKITRTDADTRLVLAKSYQALGKMDEAIEQYREALRFTPEFTAAYQGLEECYRKTGRADEAEWAGAMAQFASGSYNEAVARLTRLATKAPTMKEVQWGLGVTFARMKDTEKASAAFRAALAIDPSYKEAKDGLARLGIAPQDK
ncbi:MAG: tetratricopeptide repeat protein [Dehalococcoidales bacterium]|nr:tetratricopeptide repeat protein [Dehalococcoidales bacterium]